MSNQVKDYVVERIIKQLEQGTAPWAKPWFNVGKMNPVTGIVYSGVNRLLLADSEDTIFLTFKQISEHGAKVIKGSSAWMVVFWKVYTKTVKDESGQDQEKKSFVLRYYNVFGLSQVEGLKPDQIERWKGKANMERNNKTIDDVEQWIAVLSPSIKHSDGNGAFYSPLADYINMPRIETFINSESYYGTLFHELTHWTGHTSRTGRIKDFAAFGSESYGKEELCAEIGAAMLNHNFNIPQIERNAAYIQNWINAIKADNNIIFSAATKAEEAFLFMTEGVKNVTENRLNKGV